MMANFVGKRYCSSLSTVGRAYLCADKQQFHFHKNNLCVLLSRLTLHSTSRCDYSAHSSFTELKTVYSKCQKQKTNFGCGDAELDPPTINFTTRRRTSLLNRPQKCCGSFIHTCSRIHSQNVTSENQTTDNTARDRHDDNSFGASAHNLPTLTSEEDEALSGVHESEETELDFDSDDDPSELSVHTSQPSLQELTRRRVTTLAPFVNKSETLQKVVQLGVDLSVVQQVKGLSSLLVRSDFDRDIAPYVKLLVSAGVSPDYLGRVLTINPHVLTMDLGELELKIGYLIHKKFTVAEVGVMVGRAPVILLMSPQQMDGKLHFLQNTLDLTADEVRSVVNSAPRLLPYKKDLLALNLFKIESFLGFEGKELKQLIVKEPKLLMNNSKMTELTFDYLHNTMGVGHSQIMSFPGVLAHRLHVVKERHLYLVSRLRAQYDPAQENYVSMKALVTGSDAEFCERVAKADLKAYYHFLKTL